MLFTLFTLQSNAHNDAIEEDIEEIMSPEPRLARRPPSAKANDMVVLEFDAQKRKNGTDKCQFYKQYLRIHKSINFQFGM